MQVRKGKGYIALIAPALVHFIGQVTGGKQAAETVRALVPFPGIIIFRDESQMVPWVINHERIHFRQTLELLIFGGWLLWLVEQLWSRFVLRLSPMEAYLWSSSEQEAYRNQQDSIYLSRRKPFARFWYMAHKRRFTLGAPGEIVFQDEGAV